MGFTLSEYGSSELFYCMRGSELFNLFIVQNVKGHTRNIPLPHMDGS